MARQLKTGWVTVATSGQTVDYSDRIIEKEWLEGMADSYDPKIYSARIWPEHSRYYPTGGKVVALKTIPATHEDLKDEIHLQAIIAPNDWLIEQNRQGQYTHTSIEVEKDFMDGKYEYYLGALAVTDDEASAGTDELLFNAKSHRPSAVCFKSNQIDVSKEVKQGFLDSVSKIFNKPDQEDDTMKPEQLAALQKSIEDNVNTQFAALAKSLNPAPKEGEDEPEVFNPAAFKALQEENTALKTDIEDLKTKFAALDDAPAGDGTDAPEGEGPGDVVEVI